MAWKVLLKSGETLASNDFNGAYYESDMLFIEKITKHTETVSLTTGWWKWRKTKEYKHTKKNKEVVIIVPFKEIKYIYSGEHFAGHEFIEGGDNGGKQKHEKREEEQTIGDTSTGEKTNG